VKGLVTSHHGLRPERVSADADVWVDPEHLDAYLNALSDVGWHEREASRAAHELIEHSVTLIHPEWPCDLDVHQSFPGFLRSREEVFEVLWERREKLEIAGHITAIPDRTSAILITALHAMRSPHQTPRHGAELRGLVRDVIPALSSESQQDLLGLATQLNAVDTARPVLAHVGLDLPAPVAAGSDSALDAWRQRTAGGEGRTTQFVLHIRSTPWRERPREVFRAIWPTEADFRVEHYTVPPGYWHGVAGRLKRIAWGIRQLPGVLRGRRLARQGITDDSLLHEDGER